MKKQSRYSLIILLFFPIFSLFAASKDGSVNLMNNIGNIYQSKCLSARCECKEFTGQEFTVYKKMDFRSPIVGHYSFFDTVEVITRFTSATSKGKAIITKVNKEQKHVTVGAILHALDVRDTSYTATVNNKAIFLEKGDIEYTVVEPAVFEDWYEVKIGQRAPFGHGFVPLFHNNCKQMN